MINLDKLKEAYYSTPDHDKEALKFAGTYLVGSVIFDLTRTAIIYKIGRKIAPNIFTSFGRTYAISYALRLAVRENKLTDDQKERLKALKDKQQRAKEDKYHQSEAFAAALRRRMGNPEK